MFAAAVGALQPTVPLGVGGGAVLGSLFPTPVLNHEALLLGDFPAYYF